MSKPFYQRIAHMMMDGVKTRTVFPSDHFWNLDIIIKTDPKNEDIRQRLIAVIFEGKCRCGGKLFLGIPAPRCWAFESQVPTVFYDFLNSCLEELYDSHFGVLFHLTG